MKNKGLIILITSTVVCLIVLLIVLILIFNNNEDKNKKEFIYMGEEYHDYIEMSSPLLTSYEEYKEYFDSKIVLESDFNKYNYAVVEVQYDPCSENNIKLVDYSIEDNVLSVKATYESECGVCAPEYLYYLLPVDKDFEYSELNISYSSVKESNCPQDVAYKPIIYLYPESETSVTVKVDNPNYLTVSYPKYNNGWKVLAKPNGDLYDENGRYYYGLYWEGSNHKASVKEDGFVVSGEDSLEFLQEKLAVLGLNEREADEFIIYWLPKLEKNKYNYIRFETKEEIDSYMSLDINPNPDTVIRVFMDYKPLDEKIDVIPQELTTLERVGFTVVEWGGSIIK